MVLLSSLSSLCSRIMAMGIRSKGAIRVLVGSSRDIPLLSSNSSRRRNNSIMEGYRE